MLKEELLNSNQLDIEIRQLLQTQNEPFKQKYDKEDFNTNLHDSSIPSDIESDYRTLIEMEEGTIQSQNNEDELDKINEQIVRIGFHYLTRY
ncbi:hypothetical protein K502DRAFT_322993 [Neoconidiobolus thromboides FSU 785]|nr:hypothetical protein K502DRAFT_322993 [Neoconidiobolus thromboides FSU 785]